jgi:predicted polyphosphate/ATP-dependent NAD kinase
LFCGGDGTARDVSSAAGVKVPVLGIPSGVKMYSSCFAVTPEAAAKVVSDFICGKTSLKDAEVLDIDEGEYRMDRMIVKFFSNVKTPYVSGYVQGAKAVFLSQDEEKAKEEIAGFCVEFMRDSSLYLLGPGTTTKKIFELLGLEKTLLGVDAVKDGRLVAKDLNEKQILNLIKERDKVKIIVSPLGRQGFIFGRGNQQISDKVIEKAGIENIIVIATPHKLFETDKLFVDTGNSKINKMLSGRRQVVCGYMIAQLKDVVSI